MKNALNKMVLLAVIAVCFVACPDEDDCPELLGRTCPEDMDRKFFCDECEHVWYCGDHGEGLIWGPSNYDCLCIDAEGYPVTTGVICG